MKAELLPCPFCAEDKCEVMRAMATELGWWVFCPTCQAEGPWADNEADAGAQWNIRPQIAYTNAQISAGIIAATAAYIAGPNTSYLAEKFGLTKQAMLRRLQAMERAGLVRHVGRHSNGFTWAVTPVKGL